MTTDRIEQRFEKLEHQIERLKAINDCHNLMGKLQHWHTANMNRQIATLFAKKAPGIRLYWGQTGYWEGPEGPVVAGEIGDNMAGNDNVGHMPLHLLTTPIVEVAGDGQTAKGVWMAVGMVAMVDHKTNKPKADWEWTRYGVDFVIEDGVWKIRREHVMPLIRIPWNGDWEETYGKKDQVAEGPGEPGGPPPGGPPGPGSSIPKHPPTPLDVEYSPYSKLPYLPVPEPYETFDPAVDGY